MTQDASARRDPDSVYRVVQLVASHPESWERAACRAVAEATKTITDLRVARVVELDTVVRDGAVAAYRVRLAASYRVDRRRRGASGATQLVRRYLVVANQTVGGDALGATIRRRMSAGPAEFHVLVPATMPKDFAAARRLAALGVDPTTGYAFGDLGSLVVNDDEGRHRAQERLQDQLLQLGEAGATATGEVGEPDPLAAIAAVLARADFDEIILSTLPTSVSRWVRLDLPTRVMRRFGVPVTHVVQDD